MSIITRTTAILLAAGSSGRMGGRDKLLLPFGGKTLFRHAVELLDSFPFHEKIIVTTRVRHEQTLIPPSVCILLNSHPEAGQSESMKLGLNAATGDWYLFLTADQPLLRPASVEWLFAYAEQHPDKIVYPAVDGSPRSPTIFPARFRGDLLKLVGDTGGRVVREKYPEACIAARVECSEEFTDIDDDNDYIALENKLRKLDG